MEALLEQAATLRDAGCPWAEVARRCHRHLNTVECWPSRYPTLWSELLEKARSARDAKLRARCEQFVKLVIDGGIEASARLRGLA